MKPSGTDTWSYRLVTSAAILCIVGVAIALILPAFQPKSRSRRPVCVGHIRNIQLAILNYSSIYNSIPPAYTTDADGKPLHSWRTLMLPYLDQAALYERLRLDERWDSPYNMRVFGDVGGLDVFVCPSDKTGEARPHQTNYLAVVGSETIWTGSESRTLDEVTDGQSRTIMLVEAANSGIDWFEPRDLSFDELSFKINDPDRPSPGSGHSGVINVAFADGSARTLAESTPPETLRALLTASGGETVDGF